MRSSFLSVALAATLALGGGAAASECPGDVNTDGVTDFADIIFFLAEWGPCPGCTSDINGDDDVNFADLIELLADWGCVVPAVPSTMLSGTVTNLWTAGPIAGASVHVGEDVLVTNAAGHYSGSFPVGLYTLSFEADNYLTEEQDIILFPNIPLVVNKALAPEAPVIVTIAVDGAPDPGGTVEATAVVEIFDGSMIQGYSWSQVGDAPALIGSADTESVAVQLGTSQQFKAHLHDVLAEPPIGPDQLPPGVPLPDEEFPGGLQNRFEITGVNHFALEEAGLVGLAVEVTTSSGTYDAEADLHANLPWKASTGVRNVAIDVPVLLHGKTQGSYAWSLTKPAASTSTLADPTTKYPNFTPDVPGLYTVSVFDSGAGAMKNIPIYAGNWRGVIVGEYADGRPIPDPACYNCHTTIAPDKFTPWTYTGHAEIFTENLDTSTHYSSSCFECHSVGYNPAATNNGFDDAADFEDFMNSGLINHPGDNWATMLDEFPIAAKRANIQCENCHGPQQGAVGTQSAAHMQHDPRVSLSADVCASCHGEPLRHGRYQQWQLSGHANYELAIDEGTSGNCSRCHSVNGFLTWLPVLLGQEPGDPLANITVTWTADEVHPQTCTACHDPHAAGNISGDENNATVRITGNTPPLIAGFTAYGVGRGAICITCHNSRRGLHNDAVFDDIYGTSEASRTPHHGAQGDVLMGQNAYLVTVGMRANHSFLTDTCAQCHMEQTPPPDELSYNATGTNHTFYARTTICSECHGPGFEAETIQSGVQSVLDLLQEALQDRIFDLIEEQIALGRHVDFDGDFQLPQQGELSEVVFGAGSRQQITVRVGPAFWFGPYNVNNIDIIDTDGSTVLGELYDFADPNIVKGGWNWALFNEDGSLGIHNPTYVYAGTVAALEALNPAAAATLQQPAWLDMVSNKRPESLGTRR